MLQLADDRSDLHLGIRLSVADLLLLVLLRLISQNINLLALTVLDDVADNACTCYGRIACLEGISVGNCEYLVEGHGVAFICIEFFDVDDVAFVDFILLSACFDDSKHEKHLSFYDRFGLKTR